MKDDQDPKNGFTKVDKSLEAKKSLKPHEALELKEVTWNDIAHFGPEGYIEFTQLLNARIRESTPEQREAIYKKVWSVLLPSAKNDLWHHNHASITYAIAKCIREKGRMPSTIEIVEEAELSRQTVIKHLKEYKESPLFNQIQAERQLLADRVLDTVARLALAGDMKAAKLFLTATGKMAESAPINNTQNNYIQINSTILSQKDIQQLPQDQRELVEAMLLNILLPLELAVGG